MPPATACPRPKGVQMSLKAVSVERRTDGATISPRRPGNRGVKSEIISDLNRTSGPSAGVLEEGAPAIAAPMPPAEFARRRPTLMMIDQVEPLGGRLQDNLAQRIRRGRRAPRRGR